MKRHWLLCGLIALALAFMAGCEQAEPTVAEPTPPTPEELAVDPSTLPPPRAELDSDPDLSGASLVINEATLAKMSADAVPANVIDSLRSLEGREFANASEFSEAVRDAAGSEAEAYMDRILRNALVIQVADAAPAPEGEVSIAQREEEQAMVKEEPAMMPDFGLVYFDFDKSNIKPEFEQTIRENAQVLLDNPDMQITIEGHCDERGTNEYNLALGQRRAESVRQALIAEGVPAGQLSTISYGEERPVALGHNEEAWAQNRRAAIVTN